MLTATNVSFDRTGMPLIFIPSLSGYVNFFPVTKVSFEYFLCDRVAAQTFDNAWYSMILEKNGRIAVGDICSENVEQAFITAVTPDEISRYSRWLGQNNFHVRLLTSDEWTELYRYANSQEPVKLSELEFNDNKKERTRLLVKDLLDASNNFGVAPSLFGRVQKAEETPQKLSRQMFLKDGIAEWVVGSLNGTSFYGARGGLMRRLEGDGMDPANPRILYKDRAESRPRFVGFRLFFQGRS